MKAKEMLFDPCCLLFFLVDRVGYACVATITIVIRSLQPSRLRCGIERLQYAERSTIASEFGADGALGGIFKKQIGSLWGPSLSSSPQRWSC